MEPQLRLLQQFCTSRTYIKQVEKLTWKNLDPNYIEALYPCHKA